MKSWKRKLIENVAEKQGWNTAFYAHRVKKYNKETERFDKEVTETFVEFEQSSPAGEDVILTVFYHRFDDIPMELYEQYEDFDVDDHAMMWLEAKKNGIAGVPGVRTLAEDAEWQEQAILDLSLALRSALDLGECLERPADEGRYAE